jgi:hypothetical protein
MTHREKLFKLHSRAMVKTLVLIDYEGRYISDDGLCGVTCDPINNDKRIELYIRMQEALKARDELARRIMEQKIQIDSPYLS